MKASPENKIRVLGIETSCDETAISLIEVDERSPKGDSRTVRVLHILGNTVHSQIDVHASYGGVFPTLAKREHQRNLVPVLQKTLEQAEIFSPKSGEKSEVEKKIETILAREPELLEAFKAAFLSAPSTQRSARPDIDYISVTIGPGLEPALWVGINFARALATLWNVPIVPCNHMEGHILTALIRDSGATKDRTAEYALVDSTVAYPALSLLISGGHTQIVLVEKIGADSAHSSYRIVGETLDDAVGECFDKIARMLGLAYPGGPKISKLAAEARAANISNPEPLPRPMISSGDMDFSFSGLKTAVLYMTRRLAEKGVAFAGDEVTAEADAIRKGICREVEDAITDVLVAKMRRAISEYGVSALIIGGGVIANSHIRQALENLARECSLDILMPQTDHSTDNGLMIALAGYINRDKAVPASTALKADGTLAIGPRLNA